MEQRFQSSLRDELFCASLPGVETPGYYHLSLRDKAKDALKN